jgi:hypothetical protein
MPPTDRLLSVTPRYIISTIRTVCKHLDINSPPREKDVRKSSRQSQKNEAYSEQVNRIGSHMQRSGVALWSARDNERSEAAPLWYLRRQAAARRRPGNPGDRGLFLPKQPPAAALRLSPHSKKRYSLFASAAE